MSAAGLPNDQGHLIWPLGVQVLFPISERTDLLNQLEARFQTAVVQKTAGAVDGELLEGASQDIGKFRKKLREREPFMGIPTYQQADHFLNKMDSAVNQLQGNKSTSKKQ